MQDLKDTGMLYGLLRQSPGIWVRKLAVGTSWEHDQKEDATGALDVKPKARKLSTTSTERSGRKKTKLSKA